jgi:2-oxoglutarate ferredoxin oxidoreductase subunit gamma
MLIKTLFAGAGGQGVLSMGFCLAYAGMEEDLHVTYMPAYGAEVRGGTANCTIVVSDEEIASPIASSPDNIVILNNPSLLRFQNAGRANGTYLINSSLVNGRLKRTDVTALYMPASEMAEKSGSLRNTNMMLLGAFVATSKVVPMDTMLSAIADIFAKKNKKVIDINQQALQAGYDWAAKELAGKAKPVAKKKTAKKPAAKTRAAARK